MHPSVLDASRARHLAAPRAAPRAARRYLAALGGALLGLLAGLASGTAESLEVIALAATFAVLALASAIDLEERRIPNRLTYPAIGSALLVAALLGEGLASIAGLTTAGGFMVLAAIVGGDQLGMGDVKLSAFAGAALGVEGVPVFLLAGTLSGAVIAVATLVRQRDRRATLAYGPCLSFGAAVAALTAGTVLS